MENLRKIYHELSMPNELTDVTLVCDDRRQFKAHKMVLSACSPVFKSIFNDLPENTTVIFLTGIQHQEMESILEFMYLGVTNFNTERMKEFLIAAKSLEIKGTDESISVNYTNENKTKIID